MEQNTPVGAQEQRRQDLSVAVATAYDLQKLRIMTGNRICASFRLKLGLQPSESEEELEEQNKKVFVRIRADYDLMTEGVVAITKADGGLIVPRATKFKPVGCITTLGEFMLIQQYLALEAQESDHFNKNLPMLLHGFPIYDYYLEHVRGIGPAMAAIIVRYLDIEKAPYPSSFWKFAGLDVVAVLDEKTGEMKQEGRGRKKSHLVPRSYVDSEGEAVDTVGISYHPFLKTKLMGVLAGSFLKCKSPYAELYYNYRNRLENHARYKDVSKGHRHQMAQRYMVKQFLVDLHANWRDLENTMTGYGYWLGESATNKRVYLRRVEPNGPAFAAGLRVGDTVISINSLSAPEALHGAMQRITTEGVSQTFVARGEDGVEKKVEMLSSTFLVEPTLTYQEAKLGHVHGGGETRPRLTTLVFPENQRKAA